MYTGVVRSKIFIMFSVPPLTNTLSSETSFVVKAGYEMSLSCTTGSSNPVSKMVWEKGESEETIVGTSTNGDYGGKVLNSSYTFSPQKSDNGAEVSCTPKWKDKLLTKLKKNVTMDVLCKYWSLLKVFNTNGN